MQDLMGGYLMTNRQIRKRAWELFQGNYAGMLPAMFIMGLTSIVSMFWNTISGPLRNYFSSFISVLLAPVSVCGVAAFCLNIQHGGTPKTSLMFAHFRDFHRVLNIWIAALAVNAPMIILTVLMTSFGWADSASAKDMGTGLSLLSVVLFLGLSIVFIWLSLRLGLYGYAAALNPDARFSDWLGASYHAMRRNCWRDIRLTISTGWPIILALIFVFFTFGLFVTDGSSVVFRRVLPTAITSLLMCFYQGYPQIALALFAEDLLEPQTSGMKKHIGPAIGQG
jgi:hypothetical protein